MSSKGSSRRRFLKEGVALTGLAAAGARPGMGQVETSQVVKNTRPYGERSRFVTSARIPDDPTSRSPAILTPIQDSAGIITPSGLHFIAEHYDGVDIDPQQHRLLIHGMVDRPLIFTMDDLKRLPAVSRVHFLECPGNTSLRRSKNTESIQQTHGRTSCSEWTGVLLSVLLRRAGVQKGASWIVAESADRARYIKSIPLDKAMDDILLAYYQNGEPVRPEQGFPLRLFVPGWEAISSVKWLRRIEVVDQPHMARWETITHGSIRGDGKARWFEFEMGPKSVITRPSLGQRLPSRGYYEITGLAWSGGGGIRRVEVSTDGGRTWKDAQIHEPVYRMAHTRFSLDWTWDGTEQVIQSRCTDERGDVQPTLEQLAEVWGVDMEYWKTTTNNVLKFNPIFRWRVTRDGSVQNALFS